MKKRSETNKKKKEKKKKKEEEEEEKKCEESMRDIAESTTKDVRNIVKRSATLEEREKERGMEIAQERPMDLGLMYDASRRTEELSLNDDEKEKESDVNENKEEKRSIAQTLEDMRTSRGEKLVAWQLPPDLPFANGEKLLEVPDLRAGQLGEIQVYADGTVKLVIGECMFDLENGASYRHHEEFVVIDEKKKKCAFIGDIVGRVVATPDVDQLIEQSGLKDDSGDDDDDDDDDDDNVV